MPEVGVDGQRRLKAGERAVHRRRRPRLAGGDVSGGRRRRHASASSTSTSSTSATCSGRSCTARRTSAGRSSRRRRIACTRSTRTSQVETYETALSSENALELFEPYDVILDGTDNFPTRYLVNDACVLLGKPNAYGSIFRFEGQASVFATKDGPCYRCLYPEPPPPGLVPSCAEGGVLGVLPGIIGVIQATEAIKLIIGIGEPLIGRFLIYDALRMRFRELKLRKDPDCPVCGTHPTVTKLIDYEQFCGVRAGQPEPRRRERDAATRDHGRRAEAAARPRRRRCRIVDVREPNEYQINRIPGSVLIPLGELPQALRRARPETTRSSCSARWAGAARRRPISCGRSGSSGCSNLKGGILDWIDKVDPSQPKY